MNCNWAWTAGCEEILKQGSNGGEKESGYIKAPSCVCTMALGHLTMRYIQKKTPPHFCPFLLFSSFFPSISPFLSAAFLRCIWRMIEGSPAKAFLNRPSINKRLDLVGRDVAAHLLHVCVGLRAAVWGHSWVRACAFSLHLGDCSHSPLSSLGQTLWTPLSFFFLFLSFFLFSLLSFPPSHLHISSPFDFLSCFLLVYLSYVLFPLSLPAPNAPLTHSISLALCCSLWQCSNTIPSDSLSETLCASVNINMFECTDLSSSYNRRLVTLLIVLVIILHALIAIVTDKLACVMQSSTTQCF